MRRVRPRIRDKDGGACFLTRWARGASQPELQVFLLVSHLVPRRLCLAIPLPPWAAGGRHVSVGASVGGSADVRKQGPTHTAWVSVSPGSKQNYANYLPRPRPPLRARGRLTYAFLPLKFMCTRGQLRICITFTLKCPGAILKQDSPFRRATVHIK